MFLDEPSVTATENLIMAAVLAEGSTTIENAACEPHVQDLCGFLITLGARISGIGSNILRIEGVERLRGGSYTICRTTSSGKCDGPAAVTRSPITIGGVRPNIFKPIDLAWQRLGIDYEYLPDDRVRMSDTPALTVRTDLGGAIPKIETVLGPRSQPI